MISTIAIAERVVIALRRIQKKDITREELMTRILDEIENLTPTEKKSLVLVDIFFIFNQVAAKLFRRHQ